MTDKAEPGQPLDLVPEDAIGDGPFIRIPLPTEFAAHVPLNATRLLREWEVQLRPITFLVDMAKRRLGHKDVWDFPRTFVEPTATELGPVRKAADEDELINVLAWANASWGTVTGPDDESIEAWRGQPMRKWLVAKDADGHFEAHPAALAVLLGLVVVAIEQPIGYLGSQVAHQLKPEADDPGT